MVFVETCNKKFSNNFAIFKAMNIYSIRVRSVVGYRAELQGVVKLGGDGGV